jgi:hypothetical protein
MFLCFREKIYSGAWFAVFTYNFWKINPNLPLQKKKIELKIMEASKLVFPKLQENIVMDAVTNSLQDNFTKCLQQTKLLFLYLC